MNKKSTCTGGTLLQKTKQLLKETDRSYLRIHSDTGLTPAWLTALATGRMPDPSVNRVQKLYEYLKQAALTV